MIVAKNKLFEFMSFNHEKKKVEPIEVFEVNGSYILGVYGGSFSKRDILIKYRQKNGDSWSRIRTPKHIHWAVDIMLKMQLKEEETKRFLDFLIDVWGSVKPIRNEKEKVEYLKIENLLTESKDKIKQYEDLSQHGEYSVNFLILLAKLLMIQEKTNLENAYMFKKLLDALRDGGDIFKIVSTATHNRRKR